MRLGQPWSDRLEQRWAKPAYSGGLLSCLAIFFFIAATNTLSGWLYVMSGVIFALLGLALRLVTRNVKGIRVDRHALEPVTAGEPLQIRLDVSNASRRPKILIQVEDRIPPALGPMQRQVIETLAPRSSQTLTYEQPTTQRGIYRWQTVDLRTGAPLGLFWARRPQPCPTVAIVHPMVLSLQRCPMIDQLGRDMSLQFNSDRRIQSATEGVTRSLRPYRWGDPIRLIHWRTSARYGELRVRELELFTAGQEVVICLDSARSWVPEDFEQAVIAAASLYFYGQRQQLRMAVWTAGTGLVKGDRAVLDTLAATNPNELVYAESLPDCPIIWLTPNGESVGTLPPSSRWLLWSSQASSSGQVPTSAHPGLWVQPDRPLVQQLQAEI